MNDGQHAISTRKCCSRNLIPRERKVYMKKIREARKKLKVERRTEATFKLIEKINILGEKIILSHREEKERKEKKAV